MNQVSARIAHHIFELSRADVEHAVRNVLPDPLDDHYVVVHGRRFPPKQVISLLTGLDRADFNTHHARQILSRLGFTVGRRTSPANATTPRSSASRSSEADSLRPFVGQWVAQCGDEVLVAAGSPTAVLEWLEQHDQRADAMFRVPLGESEADGLAPA